MINEIVICRSREALLVQLQTENDLQDRMIKVLDSIRTNREKQIDELHTADEDHKLAYASVTKSLEVQAKEIRKQKRLKLLFGGVAILVLVIDHAR